MPIKTSSGPQAGERKKRFKRSLKLYDPHEKQLEIHSSQKRFRIVAFGRQAGKSTCANNELIKKAWENPKTTYWYLSPTYDGARVMFRRAWTALQGSGPCFNVNQSELTITLINGSKIFYKSGEVFQNLRGEALHGAIIDEVREQNPELWPMIIRPMLVTTNGWALFISTPNGYDHFFDMFEYAKTDSNWDVFHAPSNCNPLITDSEIQDAKRTMSEAEFAQEIMAEFRDLTKGKTYITHGSHNQILHTPFVTSDPDRQVSDKLPIVIGLDFNLSPMSWHLGQTDKTKWYWFDEIHLNNSHTPEATQVLIEKLKDFKTKGLLKAQPNLIICGDATGSAGQRAAAAQSDYDILLNALRFHGFTYDNRTPEANPRIKDRIQTVNTRLKAADGSVTLFYNPQKCPALKKDFDRVVWKADGVLDEGTQKDLTHASDSIGYPVTRITPLKSSTEVGTLRVIIR